MAEKNPMPDGGNMTYEEKISGIEPEEWFEFFGKLRAEPRWVNSAGKQSIQMIGMCHHGDNYSALFDPSTLKVTCFSECGGGMLLHTWVKRALNLDHPQGAKDFVEEWIDGQDIDFAHREISSGREFEYKERPFEPEHIEPLPGIDPEIIKKLYSEFDTSLETLDRLVWHTEDGIEPETLKLYDVAASEDGIILPHHNINGEIVGMYERNFLPIRKKVKEMYPDIEYKDLVKFPRAKYVPLLKKQEFLEDEEGKTSWSFPNTKNLYGLHLAKNAIKETGKAIIFEGGKSVMLAHQMGIEYAVASHTFGAHVNHISMLIECGAKEIYLAFDKQYQSIDEDDLQWKLYEKKTRALAERVKKYVDVYRIIDFKDPDKAKLEYKDAPIDKGEEVFRLLLENAEPLVQNGQSLAEIEKQKREAQAAEELAEVGRRVRAEREAAQVVEEVPLELLEGISPFGELQTPKKNKQFQFGDLIVRLDKQKPGHFLLPDGDTEKSVTAYAVLERLAGVDFKSDKVKITPKNDKLQVLPYSERYRAVWYFRNQYKVPLPLENSAAIVEFIEMALNYIENVELSQNWSACLDVTGKDKEAAAALLVRYGWASKFHKELPRTENAFYIVDIENDVRHYEIVEDDISLRFEEIQQESHINLSVPLIIRNIRMSRKEKYKKLQAIFQPRLWLRNNIKLGLTEAARDECNRRIANYIDALLDFNFSDNIDVVDHIRDVEIDKSNPGFTWAAPRSFDLCIDDFAFSKYTNNITAERNREQAAQLGAARSKATAERNFASVTGDEWTTAELAEQGIDKDKIPRLIKNGLIERTTRGHYRRVLS